MDHSAVGDGSFRPAFWGALFFYASNGSPGHSWAPTLSFQNKRRPPVAPTLSRTSNNPIPRRIPQSLLRLLLEISVKLIFHSIHQHGWGTWRQWWRSRVQLDPMVGCDVGLCWCVLLAFICFLSDSLSFVAFGGILFGYALPCVFLI